LLGELLKKRLERLRRKKLKKALKRIGEVLEKIPAEEIVGLIRESRGKR